MMTREQVRAAMRRVHQSWEEERREQERERWVRERGWPRAAESGRSVAVGEIPREESRDADA